MDGIDGDAPPDELAEKQVRAAFDAIAADAALLWRQGDGEGGTVINMLVESLRERVFHAPNSQYDFLHGLSAPRP